MKRLFILFAALLVLVSACSQQPMTEQSPSPMENTPVTAAPSVETQPVPESTAEPMPAPEIPEATVPVPEAEPTPEPEPEETPAPAVPWEDIYTAFLEENFQQLHESLMGGAAGIGFIDLDLDTVPELILFDFGASASMGLQLFDIVGEQVQCVSANILGVGEAFGGEYLSEVYVNCNYFDDFRLMEDPHGNRFFAVWSGNGALDFSYDELILFRSEDGVLQPESYLYKHSEFDDEGELLAERCYISGQLCDAADYDQSELAFMQNTDTGYEASGVFLWEGNDYSTEFDGFMAMLEAAIKTYQPIE